MTAPATPTGVLITAGFGCVQVQWKAPISSASVPQPTNYTVTISPAAVAPIVLTTPGAGFKPPVVLTIGQLDNDVEYTVTVTATNGDGTSAPSMGVTATPRDFNNHLINTLSYLTGQISNDFVTKLNMNPPVMWIGPQYLTNRDDGQRIVFVPLGGPIVPGELLGDDDTWSGAVGDSPTPRQIWDIQERVEAHVWGLQLPDADPMRDTIASYAQAGFIAERMLATIHRKLAGSTIATSKAFAAGRDKTTRGAAIIIQMQIKVPVTRYDHTTGVVSSFAPTTTITTG